MTILVQYRESHWHNWIRIKFLDSELEGAQDCFQGVLDAWGDVQIVFTLGQGDEVILEEREETSAWPAPPEKAI